VRRRFLALLVASAASVTAVASPNGLVASLPLDALAGDPWTDFAVADDWYLFLVDVDATDRVQTAIRSRFRAPDDVVAF